MGKREAAGQRRAEKVLARRKRRRGGMMCGQGARTEAHGGRGEPDDDMLQRPAVGVPDGAVSPPRARERDALDDLLEGDVVRVPRDWGKDAVRAAVRRTVAEGSPRAGELLAARFRAIDDVYAETVDVGEHCECCVHYVDPDDGPGGWAAIRLVGRLMEARSDHPGSELARDVVAWVATQLGRTGPSIEQCACHLGAPPPPRPAAAEVAALDDHCELAALVWLAAGLEAVLSSYRGMTSRR